MRRAVPLTTPSHRSEPRAMVQYWPSSASCSDSCRALPGPVSLSGRLDDDVTGVMHWSSVAMGGTQRVSDVAGQPLIFAGTVSLAAALRTFKARRHSSRSSSGSVGRLSAS